MSLQGIFEVINKYQSLNYFGAMSQKNCQRIIRASGVERPTPATVLFHWDHSPCDIIGISRQIFL